MRRQIRIRDGFSDRNNIEPLSKEMQLLDFEHDTRIVLFNTFKNIIDYQIESRRMNVDSFTKIIVENVFNDVYDKNEEYLPNVMDEMREIFEDGTYHEILSVIEFVCNLIYEREERLLKQSSNIYDRLLHQDVRVIMNATFEKEYIGYRFINNSIVNITNEIEIDAIKEACSSPFKDVNLALDKAIGFISESGKQDFKNSIKESISAVEQLFNILLKTDGLVLSNSAE